MPAAVGFFSMIDPGEVVSPVAVRVGASGEVLVAPLLRIVPLAVASGTLPRWLFSAVHSAVGALPHVCDAQARPLAVLGPVGAVVQARSADTLPHPPSASACARGGV